MGLIDMTSPPPPFDNERSHMINQHLHKWEPGVKAYVRTYVRTYNDCLVNYSLLTVVINH